MSRTRLGMRIHHEVVPLESVDDVTAVFAVLVATSDLNDSAATRIGHNVGSLVTT